MEQVLLLIFQGFSNMVKISKSFTFSAFGFSLSLWDFQIALFVISTILPLFFSLKSPRVSSLFGRAGSERNDRKDG